MTLRLGKVGRLPEVAQTKLYRQQSDVTVVTAPLASMDMTDKVRSQCVLSWGKPLSPGENVLLRIEYMKPHETGQFFSAIWTPSDVASSSRHG